MRPVLTGWQRYWKSAVHLEPPATDPIREGILELTLLNQSTGWVEVTRATFNAYGMKIYLTEERSLAKGRMRIEKPGMAETEFTDIPAREGMTKAYELFQTRKPAVISKKFIMDGDL